VKKAIMAVLVAALLVSGLLIGCGGVLTGSGDLQTKEYALSDFTSVDIGSAFEFSITQSNSYGVSIIADDNILEQVMVTKQGNTLNIGLKAIPTLGPVTLKAEITMPQLDSLEVSGASRGSVSGFSSNEKLDLEVSGASRVTGDIAAGDTDFDVSGASTVQLEGSANNILADVSGASRLNLDGFKVNNADVTFSGASTGVVNLDGKLDADLSGASKLSYIGEPIMGDIDTSGASKLNRK
jgi:hypothetical protein